MKALIGFVSLALGAAIVAALVKIQTDPFAFTSHTPVASEPALATAAAEPAPVQKPHVITLADVTIVGHLSRHAFHRARAMAAARVTVPAKPAVKVIPAPCVNGQYRKLEPDRGVRLICPH